ncbi:MAG TPA: TonB-dependent receptor [Gemmatimonadaceae bacterium]|nr:TonB-dependent receptor [Gemmatimonadaceae bacterium]
MATVRYFFPTLIGLLSTVALGAQTPGGTITGRVVDNTTQQPLTGVTVSIEGTTRGTATQSDGTFRISNVPEGNQVLRARRIGYVPMLRNVAVGTGATATVDFSLVPSPSVLDQVVVVGYSSARKADITGAVATVDVAELESRRVADVAQALQGQVAGVQITQSTGAPGEEISIRIRGEGTIGNNSPLFIVDGIPTRDISFLNPADMASLTVLKDAAAASIYGSRASAGVIVITTKSGKVGKVVSEINAYTGIQRATNLPTLLNSSQYLDKVEEAWNNSGNTGTNPYTAARNRPDLADTDWLDELFEPGVSQNLQLTASGGSERIKYLTSAGLYKQDGIVIFDNDRYRRLNFRTNVIASLSNRFNVGTNLQLSYAAQDKLSSKGDTPGIIRHALIRPPVISVYKDSSDPTYSEADQFTDLPFFATPWDNSNNRFEFGSNPVALAFYTNDKRDNFKTFGNVFAEYSLLRSQALKFKSNLGIDLSLTHNKAFLQRFGDDNGGGNPADGPGGRINRPTGLNEDRGQETTVTWNNTLNYIGDSEKNLFTALAGTEFITNYSSSIGGSRQRYDFSNGPFQYLNYGGTANQNTGGSASEWALFSLFSSATYSFASRYLLTGTVRADASSRFAENNQWGYFPSVSAGWNISNESFMQDVSFVSDLRVRGSVGKVGNQEIDNYAFLTLLRRSGDQYLVSRYGNPDLKWETTTQKNIGFDMGMLSNRLYLSVDYFRKLTSDILLPISLPSIVGNVSPTIVNAGEVSNRGFEVALDFKDRVGSVGYRINANAATVKNNVEKLHPNLPNIIGDVYKTEVGQPLGAFYGYVMEGIYQNAAEIKSHLHATLNPPNKPGDIKFQDLNADGVINDDDRTFIGNPIPRLSYGFNLGADFRGFDLSALLQGVSGVDKYNDAKQITDYDSRPFNHTTAVLGAWDGEGSSNTIPRTTFNDNGSSKKSSIFVEDASYLRLKNLELGYSLGALGSSARLGVQNVRVYVSGQNLFTKTKYTGLDPESTDILDRGTYPQSRAFLFGTNVKF